MTVIISGHARGGTTCVSRVVNALGVKIHFTNKGNNEDYVLGEAIENKDWKLVELIVKRRSGENWGFKRPLVFNKLMDRIDLFENPKFILVTRDPTSVVGSVLRRQNVRLRQTNIMEWYLKECREMMSVQIPNLIVSYEACLIRPQETIEQIADFLEVNLSKELCDQVQAQIDYSDPRYPD